jgi:hypothetical protein
MMHKGVRQQCLVVVRAMGNICLNVVDEKGEGGGGVEAIFTAVDIVVIAAAVVAVYSFPTVVIGEGITLITVTDVVWGAVGRGILQYLFMFFCFPFRMHFI